MAAILAAERARLERQHARAARGLAVIDQLTRAKTLPAYTAEPVELDPSPVLTATGPAHGDTLTADATALISQLIRYADRAGVDTAPPVVGEYPISLEGTLTIRAHLPVEAPPPPPLGTGAGIEPSWFKGGRHGRVLHTGPLDSLPLAYHGLLSWLYASGHAVTGPFLERYLDDPFVTDPATLRTEVLHPLHG